MLVKKYGNRRLYDTAESCYITLEDLSASIQAGDDVQVIDAKTGQDLTQITLAQIILENRGAAKLLPVPLLKQLVRMGDDALGEFFGRYMTWALEVYLQARQASQAIAPWSPLAAMQLFAQSPFARFMSSAVPWSGEPLPAPPPPQRPPVPPPASDPIPTPASPPTPATIPTPANEEMAALRRELEELKRAVMGRKRK